MALAVHTVSSSVFFTGIFFSVKYNVNISPVLEQFDVSLNENLSNVGATYFIYKVLSPVRWPITAAATPVVAKAFGY